MSDILAKIVEDKKAEVAARRAAVGLDEMKKRAKSESHPRNFYQALMTKRNHVSVIAEVKKASPSAGLIREDFDPAKIARNYEANGAAAISCLTDEKYFQGKLEYIQLIRAAVDLPVLRKDFIVDEYQVWEARAAGADAILLIAECVEIPKLIDLMILATELKMTTLLEVHDMESLLEVRPHIGFPHEKYMLLGINNRNLREMKTDINHTIRLLDMVEQPKILVSESGIRTHEDVEKLMKVGVTKVLVGEHLMRQGDEGEALRELIYGVSAG